MYDHGAVLQQYAVAEGNQFNWHSQEKDLVAWWLRQAEQMNNLSTVDDERLIVLDAGQHNDGPGPDIFRSRILLDDFEMSGAVEMHVRAGDWYAHGHQHDERYHDVMLHVILAGDTGPDIPTLLVDRQLLGAGRCVSNRRISEEELCAQAYLRFKSKQQHLKALELAGAGYSPLLLGMLETIMAGSTRSKLLHQAALILGLENWPDCRIWQGSNQSFSNAHSKELLFLAVLQNIHLFEVQHWQTPRQDSWKTGHVNFADFRKIGLSLNQCREWLVNIYAPFVGEEQGFELWMNMQIFRHYGLEKRLLQRLGLEKIKTVALQQGLLAWQKHYCSTGSCSNCPLTQYHHALT